MKNFQSVVLLFAFTFAVGTANASSVTFSSGFATGITGLSFGSVTFEIGHNFASVFPTGPQLTDVNSALSVANEINQVLNSAKVKFVGELDNSLYRIPTGIPVICNPSCGLPGAKEFPVVAGVIIGINPPNWVSTTNVRVDGQSDVYAVIVNPVPLPAPFWLLGSALGGIGLMRRRAT